MKRITSKSEKAGISFIIILSIILFIVNRYDNNSLNINGIYVLGKLLSSSSKGEMSWIYNYQYDFKGKHYYRSFTGPLPSKSDNDSLMFFKILPKDPQVCQQLPHVQVPECITLTMMPQDGWSDLPLKACN